MYVAYSVIGTLKTDFQITILVSFYPCVYTYIIPEVDQCKRLLIILDRMKYKRTNIWKTVRYSKNREIPRLQEIVARSIFLAFGKKKCTNNTNRQSQNEHVREKHSRKKHQVLPKSRPTILLTFNGILHRNGLNIGILDSWKKKVHLQKT